MWKVCCAWRCSQTVSDREGGMQMRSEFMRQLRRFMPPFNRFIKMNLTEVDPEHSRHLNCLFTRLTQGLTVILDHKTYSILQSSKSAKHNVSLKKKKETF